MSWRRMAMKFPGRCVVCGEGLQAGETGLWARGQGVKHEACAEPDELKCAVCGGPAGCAACEMREDCDIAAVSQLCICKGCSEKKGALGLYLGAAGKRFPALRA